MKKLTFIMATVIVVIIAGCSKTADETIPITKQDDAMIKSRVPVPFSGSAVGFLYNGGTQNCDITAIPPWFPKYCQANGNFTHCGKSDVRFDYCIQVISMDPNAPFNGYIDGTGKIVSADGDEIWAVSSGTFKFGGWTQSGPTTNHITTTGEFTGGTGRFENASGSFNGIGEVYDLTVYPQPTELWIDGTIQY